MHGAARSNPPARPPEGPIASGTPVGAVASTERAMVLGQAPGSECPPAIPVGFHPTVALQEPQKTGPGLRAEVNLQHGQQSTAPGLARSTLIRPASLLLRS